jgi:1-phosphatidylinositol-4-phosphate 5-kinase
VTDYASSVFHRIRDAFGVSSSSFLLAWSANEIKASQVEGSSLVYSCDKRFVAMPVMDRDIEILLEMLPKYYEYVKKNPNTFLTKMFGLLRVRSFIFIIFCSLFFSFSSFA